jgi:6-phosphogluconolactonase
MTAPDFLFVGTYGEPASAGRRGRGIHALRFDRAAMRLEPVALATGIRNPSFLVCDAARDVLFCVQEVADFGGMASGAVGALRIDRASGALSALGAAQASGGADPCHLVLAPDGRHVLVANYTGGSVAVLPVGADGAVSPACAVIRHVGSGPDPERQDGPHAHCVALDPSGRFALVAELGLDRIMVYGFDAAAGLLAPNARQPWIAAAPAAGPRQAVFHPGGRFVYAVNELDSTVSAYGFDPQAGTLRALRTLSALPTGVAGRNHCAELQIHPAGRFLYVSNRGHDSIAVFALDPADGAIEPRGHVASGGRTPRHVCLAPDGDFLVAANQDSDRVVLFAIDPANGMPVPTGHAVRIGSPVCARFF